MRLSLELFGHVGRLVMRGGWRVEGFFVHQFFLDTLRQVPLELLR